MIKLKFKRNVLILIAIISTLFGLLAPALSVMAADDAEAEFNKQVDKYVGDSENFEDVLDKIVKDSRDDPNPQKNTITHVFKRMFNVGEYINDVEYGVLSKDLNVSKTDILADKRYACIPGSPNNLINHNCNIPNFTTSLIQNIVAPFMQPFSGAEKTEAYAEFGLGVPENIPGGTVPENPESRVHTYTALELFGYDLKLTAYNGEWDKIDVSTEARMLSNFGVIDKFTLLGTGLWNSVRSGMGALIENFSFNPMNWVSGIVNIFDSTVSGGLNTVLDTSDLNIVATNNWKREEFGGTLYNVYVLTDKEVLQETSKKYFREFISTLESKASLSPQLREVLALEQVPGFTFKPLWEKPESIEARRKAEARNKRETQMASLDYEYKPRYVIVPKPVYYTEKEQLKFWGDDNSAFINRAKAQGVISDISSYNNYQQITSTWSSNWELYFAREFDALGPTVEKLIDEGDREIFLKNPHLDPKQPISHYACANSDGSIKRKSDGSIEYLYLKNNKGKTQYLNKSCSPARSPIGAALFGTGWHGTVSRNDTRHIDNVDPQTSGIEKQLVNNSFMSISRSISSFIAKTTNTILGLSFSPVLSELGIDSLAEQLMKGFRDTIFFPMSTLVAVIGGILFFMQVLKGGSMWQIIASIFLTFFIFIAGAAFLLNPELPIKVIDEIPAQVDNFVAEAVLVEDDGSTYCATGTDKDGIRSAQCNVWGAMVFNPWVHLQFGTGYNNLYANGYAPSGATSFTNTNKDLVGNAEVYMGGGKTTNNWAMYQLSQTKAGTINAKASSGREEIGTVDKDLYRLVDLQAGPNNGKGTDSRYFSTWSGSGDGNLGIALLTIAQSIVMMIAIVGLGITKIEASFLFSIYIIFLPFMLLYALLPQGKGKLNQYLSTLGNLLLKRVIVTAMLAVLLRTLNLTSAKVDSITTSAFMMIAISLGFILYKKELLNLLTSSESTGQAKEILKESIPMQVQQRYQLTKAKVRGAASGFIGGAMGASAHNRDLSRRQSKISSQLREFEQKDKNKFTEEDFAQMNELQNELSNIETAKEEGRNKVLNQAIHGAKDSSQLIGRTAERAIRRQGFVGSKVYYDAQEEVIKEGANKITNKEEPTTLDTYKEVISHGDSNKSKTSEKNLSFEDGKVLMSPEVQRKVRELARLRDEIASKGFEDNDGTAITPDIERVEEIADLIDKKRNKNRFIEGVKHPLSKDARENMQGKEKMRKSTSDVKSLIDEVIRSYHKKEIEDEINMRENAYQEKVSREGEKAGPLTEDEYQAYRKKIIMAEVAKKWKEQTGEDQEIKERGESDD